MYKTYVFVSTTHICILSTYYGSYCRVIRLEIWNIQKFRLCQGGNIDDKGVGGGGDYVLQDQ
jgi:tRNA G37 N-methylase TrmD